MDVVQLLFPLKKAFPKIDWTLSELYMGTKRLDWMDTVDRQGIEPGSRILIGFRQLVAKSDPAGYSVHNENMGGVRSQQIECNDAIDQEEAQRPSDSFMKPGHEEDKQTVETAARPYATLRYEQLEAKFIGSEEVKGHPGDIGTDSGIPYDEEIESPSPGKNENPNTCETSSGIDQDRFEQDDTPTMDRV